jgi:hypothetical protein
MSQFSLQVSLPSSTGSCPSPEWAPSAAHIANHSAPALFPATAPAPVAAASAVATAAGSVAAAAAAPAATEQSGSLYEVRECGGGDGGGSWAWEAAAGPGQEDPFREDWPHWGAGPGGDSDRYCDSDGRTRSRDPRLPRT